MFYQESQIEDFLICKECHQRFNENNLPKVLKCLVTICDMCASKISILDGKFKCKQCNGEHKMTNNGLIRNETLMQLMKLNPKQVFDNDDYFDLKKNVKELSIIMETIKSQYQEQIEFINNYIKNNIQINSSYNNDEYFEIVKNHSTSFVKTFLSHQTIENFLNKVNSYLNDEKTITKFKQESFQLITEMNNLLKTISNQPILEPTEEMQREINSVEKHRQNKNDSPILNEQTFSNSEIYMNDERKNKYNYFKSSTPFETPKELVSLTHIDNINSSTYSKDEQLVDMVIEKEERRRTN